MSRSATSGGKSDDLGLTRPLSYTLQISSSSYHPKSRLGPGLNCFGKSARPERRPDRAVPAGAATRHGSLRSSPSPIERACSPTRLIGGGVGLRLRRGEQTPGPTAIAPMVDRTSAIRGDIYRHYERPCPAEHIFGKKRGPQPRRYPAVSSHERLRQSRGPVAFRAGRSRDLILKRPLSSPLPGRAAPGQSRSIPDTDRNGRRWVGTAGDVRGRRPEPCRVRGDDVGTRGRGRWRTRPAAPGSRAVLRPRDRLAGAANSRRHAQ